MAKHNKNAKSKKRILKKKSLRKTKRKNSKNSKRGGNFSSSAKNIYKDVKEEWKKFNRKVSSDSKRLELKDIILIPVGEILKTGIFIAFYILYRILPALYEYARSDNSYNGGSIFRDGKALTHVNKNPCQGNKKETVVVKGVGMGLETHDEIYVCEDNNIKILESIARTRINRYISRIGMQQLLRYKRKYHLLTALYNVPDTFDELKVLLKDASQNKSIPETKYKKLYDVLNNVDDVDAELYKDIVKALKNAVKHYCNTNNNDQELSEVCKTYNREQISTNKNKNTEEFMEGVKVLLLPTLKEMGKYINAKKTTEN